MRGRIPYWLSSCQGVPHTPIMEKKTEATTVYWGYVGENGKENESYYIAIGYHIGAIFLIQEDSTIVPACQDC